MSRKMKLKKNAQEDCKIKGCKEESRRRLLNKRTASDRAQENESEEVQEGRLLN